MSSKIINSFSETTLSDFINGIDTLYIKDLNIHLQHFSGFDDYSITDVTNALKTGMNCIKYSIRSTAPHGNLILTNWINWKFSGDISKLVAYLKALDFEPDRGYFTDIHRHDNPEAETMIFSKNLVKSINTYSPFNHANIKPLTELPAKWTMKHVVKAILNGQFDNLYCNQVLTDDYAYDAASNFRQGTIKNAPAFIKGIIESPSGWWTSIENNKVSVCCHSFDSNSFDLNIGKRL